ncbi:MAG: sodium:proton antiporter [Betaproteobacteria bacterium]|nr:sodium:proton antiporter [Betaproteobacteria bacterium]
MTKALILRGITVLILALASPPVLAADGATSVDGANLGLVWVIPFAGILLSIAIMPLAIPSFWHHHFGKVSLAWALAFLLPFAALQGVGLTAHELLHTLLAEYIPFIILLLALFTVSGGIYVRGNLHGTPALNTGLLALGTVLASIMGTTGAAMLLIRPLIRANDNRKHNVHVVVFFIFLVGNIGGSLTPLGDPPLFLGFLKGVDFFWTTRAMFLPMLLASAVLLALFYVIDYHYYHHRGEERPARLDPTPDTRVGIEGGVNFVLLGAVIACVLLSGFWKPGVSFSIFGIAVELQNVVRDVLLLAIAGLSWKITATSVREANAYSWGPILEVAKLFAGIFVTIIPAIAILRAGREGALAPLVAMVSSPGGEPINSMYFWLSGALSSFLDNAPTYLVFFNLAGGDAKVLMTTLTTTLLAISCGSVFMGANTYIGNAPNFMIKAIAEERGIKMPSFFGYMAWSCVILLPLFALITFVFFR